MRKYYTLLLALCITHTATATYTAKECYDLGYIKSQLMCSNCDKLDDFGLHQLKSECKECCTPAAPAAQQRYPKAILEVCTCKFRAYPQIEAFIKSDRPSQFPNLQIKYVRGLDPVIKLVDAKGNLKETLSITKWNTDTVEEFFNLHLEKDCKSDTGVCSIVQQQNAEEEEDEEDFFRTNSV